MEQTKRLVIETTKTSITKELMKQRKEKEDLEKALKDKNDYIDLLENIEDNL